MSPISDNQGRFTFNFDMPVFQANVAPAGALCPTFMLPCHACFYYYLLAMKQIEKVGRGPEDQILLEGEPWQDLHLEELKKTIGLIYGMSPDAIDPHWGHVIAESRRLQLPEPDDRIFLRNVIIVH